MKSMPLISFSSGPSCHTSHAHWRSASSDPDQGSMLRAMTRISVSLALNVMLFLPCTEAYLACMEIHPPHMYTWPVWGHQNPWWHWPCFLQIFGQHSFPRTGAAQSCCCHVWRDCTLNETQFLSVTLRLSPWPRCALVSASRLDMSQTSNTICLQVYTSGVPHLWQKVPWASIPP